MIAIEALPAEQMDWVLGTFGDRVLDERVVGFDEESKCLILDPVLPLVNADEIEIVRQLEIGVADPFWRRYWRHRRLARDARNAVLLKMGNAGVERAEEIYRACKFAFPFQD